MFKVIPKKNKIAAEIICDVKNLKSAEIKKIKSVLNNCGIILCDDYDLRQAPGVKKAIDEFVNKNDFNCSIICDGRFAKIEKN